MSINHFFQDILGANLKNLRWSWGAVQPLSNRVFLRVWEHEIQSKDGGRRILIRRKQPRTSSLGYPERDRHIELIRKGAAAYGVLCRAVDPTTDGVRTIADFRKDVVLQFGALVEDDVGIHAQIVAQVPTENVASALTGQSTLAKDIRTIISTKTIDLTTKEALIDARVGQGAFRSAVLSQWNDGCCVTGSRTVEAVRASHIKPWRDATNKERLDPGNGLPLTANLDALFDAGLISFADDGVMLVS